VVRGEVEVSTEIVAGGFAGIAECNGGYAGEDAVLGDLGSETGKAKEEGSACHHASLGFVSHHIELTGVQLLVDCSDKETQGAWRVSKCSCVHVYDMFI